MYFFVVSTFTTFFSCLYFFSAVLLYLAFISCPTEKMKKSEEKSEESNLEIS
ncbi:hypothetical protein M405DRAFT_290069 [Rhizopogon salebrosus TDB-379]|nr:hypothetical protein M405DRAFT_290069 [Rhizopogon salebrosus TDB-379]